jgi:2-polyprenyl-6-methoxyphenol hydroxylase-like FAD-dependent oxidoreductase
MLPHLGQGVNQAPEDAALATLLGAVTAPAGVPGALDAYEELRRGRTARPARLTAPRAPVPT